MLFREEAQLQEKLSSLAAASKEADRARMTASAEGLATANELEGLRLQLQQQTAASETRIAEVWLSCNFIRICCAHDSWPAYD